MSIFDRDLFLLIKLNCLDIIWINMELEVLAKVEENSNTSHGVSFLEENRAVAIPYLFLVSLTSVTGTLGNSLVLGSLVINKVGLFNALLLMSKP